MILFSIIVFLFALFPLTDTDVWWHLACARDYTVLGKDPLMWTISREPWINVHEYFQQIIYVVFDFGGAPLLVFFKALLWGLVFALFLYPFRKSIQTLPKYRFVIAIIILFLFRYSFEIRPVVFSLLFLGIFWNLLFLLAQIKNENRTSYLKIISLFLILCLIQWIWNKTQGLFILGPILTFIFFLVQAIKRNDLNYSSRKRFLWLFLFLFFIPFLHHENISLWLYPFNLLDRLLGLSPSASIFATEIIENRSPFVLLMHHHFLTYGVSILLSFFSIAYFVYLFKNKKNQSISDFKKVILGVWLILTAILALVAERNFVLFLPIFIAFFFSLQETVFEKKFEKIQHNHLLLWFISFFVLGFWIRSLFPYDQTMISSDRVPVLAVEWMKTNPHSGKLFNDDRMGGYLAWMNPSELTYIDGRFILKNADFFERYLDYAKHPEHFIEDSQKEGIDRAVFPLRYYARWNLLIETLLKNQDWSLVYRDSNYVVFDKKVFSVLK